MLILPEANGLTPQRWRLLPSCLHRSPVSFAAADPHIKVCGKRENVREAKDRIMSVLDTKVNLSSHSKTKP